MSDYDDNMKGVLFEEDFDPDNTRKPRFTGKVTIMGADYRLAGWTQTSKAGNRYISLKVEDPDDAR